MSTQPYNPEILENKQLPAASQPRNVIINLSNVDVQKSFKNTNDFKEQIIEVLIPGTDYGKVFGTEALTLYKAGTEKIFSYIQESVNYNIGSENILVSQEENFEKGLFSYKISTIIFESEKIIDEFNACKIIKKQIEQGEGAANSYEPAHYYTWIREKDLPLYYLQDIDFEKYISPLLNPSVEMNSKNIDLSNWSEERKARFQRRLERKIFDHSQKKELELDDLPTKPDKYKNKTYRVPNSLNELAKKQHTIYRVAVKRANHHAVDAFARTSDLMADERLIRKFKEWENSQESKTKSPKQSNNTASDNNTTYQCSDCGTDITKKAYDYSTEKLGKSLCYNCQQKYKAS